MDWLIQLADLAQQKPVLASLLYVLAYAGIMLLGLPGGIAMLLLGGFAFGNLTGAVLALVGAALAAGLTYPLARGLLGKALIRRAGQERMDEIGEFVRRQGIIGLLIVRMIPVFPFALLNVGLSVAGVRWWPFITTTVLGTVPIAVLVTRVGAKTQSIVQFDEVGLIGALARPDVFAPLGLVIALALFGLIWRRRAAD
ncbi:MAG: TVP38/TMEM64 family protein [Lysobacterales bacterium]